MISLIWSILGGVPCPGPEKGLWRKPQALLGTQRVHVIFTKSHPRHHASAWILTWMTHYSQVSQRAQLFEFILIKHCGWENVFRPLWEGKCLEIIKAVHSVNFQIFIALANIIWLFCHCLFSNWCQFWSKHCRQCEAMEMQTSHTASRIVQLISFLQSFVGCHHSFQWV